MTKKEIALQKFKDDIVNFIEANVKIQYPSGETIAFKLTDFQHTLLEGLIRQHFQEVRTTYKTKEGYTV